MTTTRKAPRKVKAPPAKVLVYQANDGSWLGTIPVRFESGARGYVTRTLISKRADNVLNLPKMRAEAEAAVPRVFAEELAAQ